MTSYKDIVRKDDIVVDSNSSGSNEFRYSIRIPYTRTGNQIALVVMMNPATANKVKSDRSINNVLTRIHVERPEVKEVVIVNLYPLYETYSSELELHQQQSELNFERISSLLTAVDFAILGWGKPKGVSAKKLKEIRYHTHALKVISMLQQANIPAFKVGELREDLYPKHLGRAPFSTLISKIDLESLSKKLSHIL
ncbi:DUF1643 domain-containing protein [Shewanella sp. BF02_Schw]|uniref:DUF1643 domain-containing protein n=1 Tax=Shewanella sp. BF02_Schw TaxID=394908 RepID=UPI0017874979|nr:DUF1643 domain-containing protein [Shewanella sp. BF02_Schw]MBO1897712.1 DUF1643 domain-containing protein [Shewanella sp. BF02_Schw]